MSCGAPDDGVHCDCWGDGAACCKCGYDEQPESACRVPLDPKVADEWGEACLGFAQWMRDNPSAVQRFFRRPARPPEGEKP